MGTADLPTYGARITWFMLTQLFGELVQFSVHTAKRAAGSIPSLLSAAESTWVDELGGLISKVTLTRVGYSEWQVGPDFTGWHQLASNVVSHASNSGNPLPPQCATVVSFLNSTEVNLPIRTRRGRVFHGPLAASSMGTDGRITTVFRDGLVTAYGNVNDDLAAVSSGQLGGEADGIVLASPFLSEIVYPVKIGVGMAIDTQRRRRSKVTEAITYTAI